MLRPKDRRAYRDVRLSGTGSKPGMYGGSMLVQGLLGSQARGKDDLTI